MTVQISTVNVGLQPNDGSGDNIRGAFIKVNNTLSNLKTAVDNVQSTYANTSYALVANLSVTNRVIGSLNLYGADTIYINGSPVQTSASSFTGGNVPGAAQFQSNTTSTSSTTGAITIPYTGGLGVGGNINTGGTVIARGNIVTTAITDATDTTSAALVSLGGLGVVRSAQIGQALIVGGTTSLNSTLSVTGDTVITSTTPSTNQATGALQVSGGVGVLGSLNVAQDSTFNSNLTINGKLTVTGNTIFGSTTLSVSDNIIDLHSPASLAPLTSDDGKDVGIVFHYYKPGYGDSHAALVWANDSSSLEYYAAGAEQTAGVFSGTYGNIKAGSFTAANSTPSTSTTTGALITSGGAGIAGNVNVGGKVITSGGVFWANGTPFVSSTYGNSNVAAYLPSYNGVVGVSGIIPNANVTANIGSSTAWFNTIFGVSTQAKYADLAEKYLPDQDYEVGTVVSVGGEKEITASTYGDLAIGVISEAPAYLMNSEAEGQAVALKGRVPVKVVGSVKKGQRLVASNNGCAVAAVPHANDVFAVALESNDDTGIKLVEAVIL